MRFCLLIVFEITVCGYATVFVIGESSDFFLFLLKLAL
jgi:hypothetical protein